MINWYAVVIAGLLGGVFALVMPLWYAVPAGVGIGMLLCHFLPVAGRHRRHTR